MYVLFIITLYIVYSPPVNKIYISWELVTNTNYWTSLQTNMKQKF